MAARTSKKSPTFEEGLVQLEAIADQLEKAELPLEELMKLFEEGTKLSSALGQKLDEFSGRMREVSQGKDGKPVSAPADAALQGSFSDETGSREEA